MPNPHGLVGARPSVDDAWKNPLTLIKTGAPIEPVVPVPVNVTVAVVLVSSLTVTCTAAEVAMSGGAVPGPQLPVHSGCVRKKFIMSARALEAMARANASAAIAVKF